MAIFGQQLPVLSGMATKDNPYTSFANQFRGQGLLGGFMPTISPYQSAISQEPGGMLQYNPITTNLLRSGQQTQQPVQQAQQPVQQAPQVPQEVQAMLPQNNAERILLNRALGRQQMQGVNQNQMTRQDFENLRRHYARMNPRQNAPRHRRGIYK